MKNYTKFIAIFLALAVLLSIPVFASDSGWHTINFSSDMVDFDAVYFNSGNVIIEANWLDMQTQTSEASIWGIPAITGEASTITFVNDFPVQFNVAAGDVIIVDSFKLKWFIGGATNSVTKYRICLGTSPLNPELTTPWIPTGYTSGQASQIVQVPNITINVNKSLTVQNFFIQFEMNHPVGGLFGLYYFNTKVEYGNPDSPQAPSFSSPDNSGVDNYDDIESGLLGSVEGSKDTVTDIYTGFSVDPFLPGLTGWIALFGLVLPRLNWLQTLLTTSLALGLFAFLFNVVAIVVKRRGDNA